MENEQPRTNQWLEERLNYLWQTYFPDTPRANEVTIKFGINARNRLGSIRMRQGRSLITLTGYFRNPTIPEFVLDETICHELVHYSHGFESPLPRLHRHPHEGRIVHTEIAKRGLSKIHRDSRRWLKDHWGKDIAPKTKIRRPRRQVILKRATILDWLMRI